MHAQNMTNVTQVTYTYRKHHLLGGEVVEGVGTIVGETLVGSEPAYIIKPTDGTPVVHVRKQGVRKVIKERAIYGCGGDPIDDDLADQVYFVKV